MKNRFSLGAMLDEAVNDPFRDGGEPRIEERQRWMLYAVAALFFCFIVWATLAKVDEQAKAQGRVVPSAIADKVMPSQPGRILKVSVSVGQTIKAGDMLLTMLPSVAQMDSATAESKFYALFAKQVRLKAEATGAKAPVFPDIVVKKAPEAVKGEILAFETNQSRNKAQLETLEEQKNQRQRELEQTVQQIADTGRTAALAQKEVGILAPLVKEGAASERDLVKAQQSLSTTQSELNRLRNAKPLAEAAKRETESRIVEFTATFKADAQSQLSQLESEIGPLEAAVKAARGELPAIEIRATHEGRVQSVNVTEGSVVMPGQQLPMLELVPDTGKLLIEARLKPMDVAFIHPDQKAVIKITAYDFSIYGGLDATVMDISPDTITDEKGESFYRVRLSTTRDCLVDKKGACRSDAKGKPLAITPGMTAEVDILTGRKRIITYLLKPFIKASQTALTER